MKRHVISRLLGDRGGNFGVITATLLPVLLGVAGVSIDLAQAIQTKNHLQGIVDSAALAAASSMASKGTSENDARDLAKKFLAAQLVNYVKNGSESNDELEAIEKAAKDAADIGITQGSTSAGKTFDVTMTASYDMPLNAMTRLVAGKTMKISVKSSAGSTSVSETAISMYLVLDRSGSMSFVTDQKNPILPLCDNYTSTSWPSPEPIWKMPGCYIRKIQALQTAASALFTSLDKSDPNKNLVRVGAVSYNNAAQTATGMNWGTTSAAAYVKAIPTKTEGGTDASGAMQIAYDALKQANSTEGNAHKSKSHPNYQRYILLMTDGEMTGSGSTWNSALDQKVRNLCDKAKLDGDTNKNGVIDGEESGIIIFSVAFMAPARGKSLLNACASGSENYYEPEDMDQLVAAFGEIAEKAAKTTTRLTN